MAQEKRLQGHTLRGMPLNHGLTSQRVTSLVTQTVKNPAAMRETWVPPLGGKDPLEESMATYSCILALRIPMDRVAWRATVHGVAKTSE